MRAAIATAALGPAWIIVAALLPHGLPVGIVLRGVVSGSLLSLVAAGIVLVYRTSGVINFAQAELGVVGAVVGIEAQLTWGIPWLVALPIGLTLGAVLGAVIDIAVIERFRRAPRLIATVATIGLAEILAGSGQALAIAIGGAQTGHAGSSLGLHLSVFPVLFDGNYLLAALAAPAVLVALRLVLTRTEYGIALRAVADNRDRAALAGIPTGLLTAGAWGVAGLLSALAVLLRVPLLGFSSVGSVSGGGTALLVRTLAAALVARMESFPRAVAAAIAIGVVEEAAVWSTGQTTLADAILVAVILVALLVQRDAFTRAADAAGSVWRAVRPVRPIPAELASLPEVRWGGRAIGALVIVGAALLPLWARASQQQGATIVVVYAIVAVSLVVLTGWAGHVSLGQFAIAGVGGAVAAVLYGRHGWDLMFALPVGIVAATAVAVIIGLPALRVRGQFLAVTTLAFAATAASLFFEPRYFSWLVQERVVRPALWSRLSLSHDWQMYEFALVGLVVVSILVTNLRRTRTGRALMAVRDNPIAAEAATLSPTRLKLTAFAISGAIAGFAGTLYVLSENGFHGENFGAETSVRLFAMAVIGGLGSLPGAVLGAVYIRGTELVLSRAWASIASGAGIVVLLLVLPDGMGGGLYRMRDAVLRAIARRRGLAAPGLLGVDDGDESSLAALEPSVLESAGVAS